MNEFRLPVPDGELMSLARRAAGGDAGLADEAAQHVRVKVFRGRYDPARPFVPWARTVLRRYCLDARRPRLRAAGGGDVPDPADPRPDPTTADTRLDLAAPFGRDDLRAVRGWKPRPRFVLLGWHGLWGKLPPADRDRTLAAVRPAVPFPVADFFAWPDRDRTRYLAAALRVGSNTVTQVRVRGRGRLAALRFVRGLRGG